MDYKKLVVAAVVLAAVGSTAIVDGVGGLGFGGNATSIAILKDKKRVDAGVTVKQDVSYVPADATKDKYTVKDFSNKPWVSWTDGLGKGFYKVSLGIDSYRDKDKGLDDYTFTADINRTSAELVYAQDFGGILGGIGISYASSSVKDKRTQTISSERERLNLGLAKAIDSKQTVLFGYQTGPSYTVTDKIKGQKAGKIDTIQNTDIGFGYIYSITNALQIGAQAVSTWYSGADTTKTFGLAVSYLPIKALELQAYLNSTNGVGARHDAVRNEVPDVSGNDVSNYGLNITYDLAKAGIIGAGVDVDDWKNKDEETKGKNVTGTLFYTLLL